MKSPFGIKFIKKSKSPKSSLNRHVLCKVDDKNSNDVYILYLKMINYDNVSKKASVIKNDYAGIFSSKSDAEKVAKCLNNIISKMSDSVYKPKTLYKVYKIPIGYDELLSLHDSKYQHLYEILERDVYVYVVMNTFTNVQSVKAHKWSSDLLFGVASTNDDVNGLKAKFNRIIPFLKQFLPPSGYNALESDYNIYIKRYKMNDVMPTMNLEDYDVYKHKENMKIITNELHKHFHSKQMKDLINELEYAPPTKPLKTGGRHYQEYTNDPEFNKRWNKTIK